MTRFLSQRARFERPAFTQKHIATDSRVDGLCVVGGRAFSIGLTEITTESGVGRRDQMNLDAGPSVLLSSYRSGVFMLLRRVFGSTF